MDTLVYNALNSYAYSYKSFVKQNIVNAEWRDVTLHLQCSLLVQYDQIFVSVFARELVAGFLAK